MIISLHMSEENKDKIPSVAKAMKGKEEKEGVQVYELGLHMLSTLTEEELAAAVDVIREEIKKHGGSFIAEGTPELIDLAYTMTVNEGGKHTKYNKAYFGWIKFDMEPLKANEMKTEVIDADKNILRYILIKTVREDTRVQAREETLQTLEEVKTTGTLEKKQVVEEEKKGEEASDIDIDKAVDELVNDSEKETKEETKED